MEVEGALAQENASVFLYPSTWAAPWLPLETTSLAGVDSKGKEKKKKELTGVCSLKPDLWGREREQGEAERLGCDVVTMWPQPA